ncbi:uncharacterized protein G6M90_00g066990 [Metarhizium brunneum]|uniref:Uncharacterized protein n=1 Tax=Metarhizium brunneum TaxID=500148 RepID=A0A7D5Z6Z6_9HYPO|nr:hypothetical protein G6M90_00g066990 [Metarhizium brunneum]
MARVAYGIVILASWLLHWFVILERLSLRSLHVRNELDCIQRGILDPPVDDPLAAEKAMRLKEFISNRCTTHFNPAFDVVQLCLFALSLRYLFLVPWMTQVALVFSLTTGILSVFLAFTLRRHMDSLLEPSDVKKWFGTPANKQGTPTDVDRQVCQDSPRSLKHEQGGEATYGMNCPDRVVRAREPMKSMRWKNVSFHAAFMMRIPTMLSVWSSGAFILGVGVYTVAHWALNEEAPNFDTADSSQDGCSSLVFLVAYNVAMVLGLLLVLVPSVLKYVQDAPIRQLDKGTNPTKGRSKLDFENRYGDFEEYFEDSGELFNDFKECCRDFEETFGYFDKLYTDLEDIFWGSVGEPGSYGTLTDEYWDVLLNNLAEPSGNTPAQEDTQTQGSCQEEGRQRDNIAEEATQSGVEEDSGVRSDSSSPEEGPANSQGQPLSSIWGTRFKQPTLKLMKSRMELMIDAEERNIKRLRLMLLKVKLNKYK